jgi:N-methylhydantoinase B
MIEDPIMFEVIKNALVSSAREMSHALRRTAFSPNIKERRDCSCAIFDSSGRLVAQSEDIPVHLGAMPMSVKACINEIGNELRENTMALLNDPYAGGSHLPDLTLVAPVHADGELTSFVANRAHHADVGGISPGSMPGLALSIEEEGVRISPRIIVKEGKLVHNSISDLLDATRTPVERLGDLSAQIAANTVGSLRLNQVAKKYGWSYVTRTYRDLQDYSANRMMVVLKAYKNSKSEFTDYMDSDGAGSQEIPIHVSLEIGKDSAKVDFNNTGNQVAGNINCPIASTLSSVYYVFISVFGKGIPINEGCWSVINAVVPNGSLLNPEYPAAVSAGNVETSQRIVDVLMGALSSLVPEIIPAASQGTMNNLTIGGMDPRTGNAFSFYETIGGGEGAGKNTHGASGIHTHMTNTLNTPIESLETEYPLRVHRYSLRTGSGGKGIWNGGDGIIREIEILAEQCTISLQSERRIRKPWGLKGGEPGLNGQNILLFQGRKVILQSKSTIVAPQGAIIRIETPGGGGFGEPLHI